MFTPDQTLDHVPATREQLVAVVEGINQPQVSVAGKPPQAVVGCLAALRNSDGSFSIFVGLHLPLTGENVVFLPEARAVLAEEARTLQQAGLQFLESMGFILDNLNFRNLSPEMQQATIERIPLFSPPRAGGAARGAADPAAAEQARVARLLASF